MIKKSISLIAVMLTMAVAAMAQKLVAAVIFAAILVWGMESIIYAVLFAIFAAYAVFGIINHAINLAGK